MQLRLSRYPNLKFYIKKLYLTLVLVVVAVIVGTAGYMIIEGYSFVEALYMTVITISTVGYKEVRELSPAGEVFTILLIITNVGIFFYGVTTLSSFIVEGELKNLFRLMRLAGK